MLGLVSPILWKIAKAALPVVFGVAVSAVGAIGKFINERAEQKKFDNAVTQGVTVGLSQNAQLAYGLVEQFRSNIHGRYKDIEELDHQRLKELEVAGEEALANIPQVKATEEVCAPGSIVPE